MNKKIALIVVGILAVAVIGWAALHRGHQDTATASQVKDSTAQQLYDQAEVARQNRDLVNAKALYQKIVAEHPNYENIETVQDDLGNLNMEIILSNSPTEDAVMHEVKSGDSLAKLAKQYGTTINLIKKSNQISNDVIRVGQKLRIWTGHFSVLVDKSQNILMLKKGDDVVKVFHVSTGKNNSTPVGQFKIVSKLVNPVWFNKGIVVPPDSPENVLGTRWMGFDIPGYGIHGTVEPQNIGQQVTAGCVRMLNKEVEALYDLLPMGTEVTIVD